MSGMGRASKVHIIGSSGNIADVTTSNVLKTDSSFRRFYPLGKIRVGNLRAVQLPNAICSVVRIRNPEGNGTVWVGGSSIYQAKLNIMCPIYETEMHSFEVNNANELSLIADNINTDVLVYALSNEDLTLTPSSPAAPDFTPPTVASTFPSGALVALNTDIYFLFNEEIDDTTITNLNITISPAITYTVTKDSVNRFKVLLIPAANLAITTLYTVTATVGIADTSGNFMISPSSFTFTTTATAPGVDITPPTIIATNPVNNVTDIAPSISPTISFSEAIYSPSISATTIKVYKDVNNSPITVVTRVLSTDMKTVTLTLSGLEYSTKYRIEVTTGIQDVTGNHMTALYTTYFTTLVQTIHTPYQVTGNTEIPLYAGGYQRALEYVGTIHSVLYNEVPIKYTFDCKLVGNPTGTLNVIILDASNTIVHTFAESLDVTTLTPAYVQYTLSSTSNTHAMAVGDKIGVNYPGAGSGFVYTKYASGSSYNGSDSYLRLTVQGGNVDYTDSDLGAIIQASG